MPTTVRASQAQFVSFDDWRSVGVPENMENIGGTLQIPLGSSDPPRGPTGPAHISKKGPLRSGHDVSAGLI